MPVVDGPEDYPDDDELGGDDEDDELDFDDELEDFVTDEDDDGGEL